MLKRFFTRQIHYLNLNNLIRGVAFSLFGIFIPIYFLNLGFSLQTVFIYYLVFQTSMLFSLVGSYMLSNKIGYKPIIIASIPFTILFLILIHFLNVGHLFLFLIAIVAGLESGFYYLPMHAYFSRLSEKNKKGTRLSTFIIFGQLAGLFGPLIGAIFAILFGLKNLFLIVALFMLLSAYPLLKLKNYKSKNIGKIKDFFKFSKKNKGFFAGTIFDNIEGEIEGHIWPIFAFLILRDLFSIGWLAFLITFGTILFTALIGRHYDKKSKYFMLRLGGTLFAVLWIARALYQEPVFILASSLVAGFLSIMVSISFESIFYEKVARDSNQDSFIIFREIPSYMGRATAWIIAIVLAYNFEILFVIAGISYLALSFLKFGVKEHKKK